MPAVQLARLKSQIADLAWKFTRPVEFQRGVNDLFELYGNRGYRAGDVVQPARKALAYHAPPLVLRQLELELARHVQENPGAALTTADALWKDLYLEPRLVAAFLVGQVPVEPLEPVIQRLQAWCQPREDRQALDGLLDRGTERLRREGQAAWLALLQAWVERARPEYESMALRALLPAVRDRQFENLPPVYQVVGPLLRAPASMIQSDLLEIIEILARRSPTETAYFLRQSASLSPTPVTLRLIRRALPAFPENLQESLKAVLKNT